MWEGLLFASAFVVGMVILLAAIWAISGVMARSFLDFDVDPCDCLAARADERDGIAKWLLANAEEKAARAEEADGDDRIVLEAAAVALRSAADMMEERTTQLRGGR